MEVSDKVKAAYHKDSIRKHISLYFPGIDKEIRGEQIHKESMYLSECLVDSKSIEFVGCISSKFKIRVQNFTDDLKGKKIIARIWTDGTEDEPVTLFRGIVDSSIRQSNKRVNEITAYDELYTKGNTEVAAWYKSLIFPVTLKNLRDSLFNYIGLEQVEIALPNDSVTIQKQYAPNTLRALSVIKAVCQINGACGIMNREGKFEYRILGDIMQVPYPSETLFPSEELFPADPDIREAVVAKIANDIGAEDFSYYENAEWEDYEVKVIDKVTIRQSEDDKGVTYGYGKNNYIIQGNIFTYGLSESELRSIAGNVYDSIGGFSYYPFRSRNNGMPFLECGLNAVSYYVINWKETIKNENSKGRSADDIVYEQKPFYILNRELSGIQALKDDYSAQGEEYQSEFITDLQTQIDLLKRNNAENMKDYAYSKSEIDSMFENFDPGAGGNVDLSNYYTKEEVNTALMDYYNKIEIDEMLEGMNRLMSVSTVPTNPKTGTAYFIQGAVRVE